MTSTAEPWRSRTLFTIGSTVLTLALVLLLWTARTMVLLVFGGVLLAVFVRGVSDGLARRTGLRATWALALMIAGFLGALALGIWLRGPDIVDQAVQLHVRLPQALGAIATRIQHYQWGQWLLTHGWSPDALSASTMISRMTHMVSSAVALVTAAFIIVFTGFYVSVEPETYLRGLLRVLPMDRRARAHAILREVGETLRWWLAAKMVSMIAVGVLVTGGLVLLDIPLAWTLGGLAALLTFIPNIGPMLSGVPPVLLALTISPERAVSVVLLMWAVHGIEGFFITPIVERQAVKLPPALTLAVQVALGIVAGPLGIALAAPLTAAGLVLVRTVYVEDLLDDHTTR